MTAPVGPRLDERRTADFVAELRQRARAWIPSWELADGERDFGRALLEIAARFNSEVAERLDRGGEKMRRGFLDWLAVRGEAARPSRMPVVFKLADTARQAVLASAPVRLQADANDTAVVFETETDVRVMPGRLEVIVAADADNDAYYLPPPGLSDLQPLEPLPTEWQLKSFAAAGATKLQLDPDLGLSPGTTIEAAGQQYRIVQVDKDLATIDPPLATGLDATLTISKVTTFAPFDGAARNWQAHALYFGDEQLFNIEAEATIEVVGSLRLRTGFTWEYWGKSESSDEPKWRLLPFDDEQQDAIVLKKPKGAIDKKEIDGKNNRWIRAYAKTIAADQDPIRADAFTIKINSSGCGKDPTVCPPATIMPSPAAVAMANTTPLVLDNIFLPLGREPRQFDAFYLGSAEAFSKKGAQVRICLELADPTFAALAVVRAGFFANTVLAGVGKDHALHVFQFNFGTISRFRDRDPLRPPLPGDNGAPPEHTTQISLNSECRPVITSSGNDFHIHVAAGGSIWTWHENAGDGTLSGWKEFDRLPESVDAPRRIDDIVPVSQVNFRVVLSNCQLWVHDGTEWAEQPTKDSTPNPDVPVTLAALVPVLFNVSGELVPGPGMVGVSVDNLLYSVGIGGECDPLPLTELVHAGAGAQGTCKTGGLRPAAYSDANVTLAVVTANEARNRLVAYVKWPAFVNPVVVPIDLPAGDQVIGATVDISFVNGTPQFSVLCKTPGDTTYVASWQPLDQANTDLQFILFRSSVSSSGLKGAPVTLAAHIVAPGAHGDLFVAPFDPFQRRLLTTAAAEDGAVLPATGVLFTIADEFSVFDDTPDRILREVAADGLNIPPDPEVLYPVTQTFGPVASNPELLAYRRSGPQFSGVIFDITTLTLDVTDSETALGTVLVIEVAGNADLYQVIDVTGYPDVAVAPDLPQAAGAAAYWTPEPFTARVAPIIRLDPATSGNWDASLLARTRLYFPSADPQVQRAKAFEVSAANRPKVLALQSPWQQAPATGDAYVIDGTLGDWQQLLADTSSNPELSWEYSNGTAWGSLILEEDTTLNLKNTGAVRFRVPDDLAATDWAGKTNHWIRARLIGGDYGREKITVKTTDIGNKQTEQTVERSSEGIRPPSVVALHISYGFCDGIRPAFVLTEDSGSTRDQSDANRTAGAIVEAFVPLATTLGRLSNRIAPHPATDECPPHCKCHSQEAAPPQATVTSGVPAATRESGRALLIGLTAAPSEAPINVLLLVEGERNHAAFAPMSVDALVADQFVPIVANDATRGLGESGLLQMTFAIQPAPRDLFGRTLTWLRLTPARRGDITTWHPTLRGAYLNAVWASATETLTRELLGSSDGAPNLGVRLARPPVLNGSLELRVREPLGEEEREALRQGDDRRVLNPADGLTGDWVLWTQVTDPGDEAATARAYALDEATGVIRFGDGRHGAIPPIGVDSIVAFSYQRTETGASGDSVPGNAITARTALNLVSPVESVEAVMAADQAAGGAPPESPDRVLRFGFARLRHRNRAVTAHDIEDLALQSSPDIVQARTVLRSSGVRLVVVMRGTNPRPTAPQARELRRLLLDAAPATLSASGALRIDGPEIRRLRIDLQLRIASLDHAGAVSRSVKERLARFFDTATGGTYGEGWALGSTPTEEDIAYALIDTPLLDSITKVSPQEVRRDGSARPWSGTIKVTELVMLADDPIRITFETTEVAA